MRLSPMAVWIITSLVGWVIVLAFAWLIYRVYQLIAG